MRLRVETQRLPGFSTALAGLLMLAGGLFGDLAVSQAGGELPDHAQAKLASTVIPEATDRAARPTRVLSRAGEASLGENGAYWFLDSPEFNLVVEKESGLAYFIRSLAPTPAYLLPPTRNGLVAYIWNSQYEDWLEPGYLDWFGVFNRLVKASVRKGKWEGKPYVELRCLLDLGDEYLRGFAQLDLHYRMFEDMLGISARVNYLKTDHSAFEVGIGHRFDPSQWTRQLYPQWCGNAITTWPVAADETSVARYREVSWDSLNRCEDLWKGKVSAHSRQIYGHAWWDSTYDPAHPNPGNPVAGIQEPFGVLEGPDRYLLWGYLDLNSFTVLAPNRSGLLPAFAIQPKDIRAGESYAFDYVYRVFPRPQATVTDVNRWYAQNLYSTNPLSRGIVRMPQNLPHRTIPPGNVSNLPGFPLDEAAYAKIRDAARRLRFTNIWGGVMLSWDELHPVTPYFMADGGTADPTALRTEIKRFQTDGYHIYQYCRQLHNSYGYFWDKARRKAWIYRGEGGWPFVYPFGPVSRVEIGGDFGSFTWAAPERLKQAAGIGDSVATAIHADFNNPDLIAWYLKDVKAAMDYYDFDGFAWDMGWDVHVGVHHGILRLQYEAAQWMKEAHPGKHNLINQTGGTPCLLYMDSVMYEGGTATDKLSADFLKAYNLPQMNLTYAGAYRNYYENAPDWKERFIQDQMRVLSYGVAWTGQGIDLADPEYEFQARLQKVAEFSALANSVPMVTESHAIQTEPTRQVTGTLWADADRLMAAVYNDRPEPAQVRITFDRTILKTYGWQPPGRPTLSLLLADASARSAAGFAWEVGLGQVVITGQLGSKELLLVE